MLPIRQSSATTPNALFVKSTGLRRPRKTPAAAGTPASSNLAWLSRERAASDIGQPGDVLIAGGQSLVDFRVRIAQSHARNDLTPSHWSTVGILWDRDSVLTVPLWANLDSSDFQAVNGIVPVPLATFDDTARFPNVGVFRIPVDVAALRRAVNTVRLQRPIVDLPGLVVSWLAFVWGAGDSPNPLLQSRGLPAAAFIETVFGMVGVEMTPGLGSASSCPEAIYQSAKWWHPFYAQAIGGQPADAPPSPEHTPVGAYIVRQPTATYLEPNVEDV